MSNPLPELIWKGRIHLGDEPGIYSDAHYSGLMVSLPVTFTSFGSGANQLMLRIEVEDVATFQGYAGHAIDVIAFGSAGSQSIANGRLQGKPGFLDIGPFALPAGYAHVAVQVSVDTSVTPGLYDDFIVTSLSLDSASHYADFGFR